MTAGGIAASDNTDHDGMEAFRRISEIPETDSRRRRSLVLARGARPTKSLSGTEPWHEHSHKFSNGFSVKPHPPPVYHSCFRTRNVVLIGRMETRCRKRPLLDGAANAFLATLSENSELRCSTNSTTAVLLRFSNSRNTSSPLLAFA